MPTLIRVPRRQRIALLADIHGNPIALDAVLADVASHGGVDGYWCLGDYAAIGHDPPGALQRLARLQNAHFVRGNTDRLVTQPAESWQFEVGADYKPHEIGQAVEVARSFAWTTGAVAVTGWLQWLKGLPLSFRALLPGGVRVLVVHASPGTDDGVGFHHYQSDDEISELLADAEADLVLVGHNHTQLDRSVGKVRIFNPGSVSNPIPPDLRASYAILETEEHSYTLNHYQVEYNLQRVTALARGAGHPGWAYISRFMAGEVVPGWNRDEKEAGR
jgi:predicted phosphodiesterase